MICLSSLEYNLHEAGILSLLIVVASLRSMQWMTWSAAQISSSRLRFSFAKLLRVLLTDQPFFKNNLQPKGMSLPRLQFLHSGSPHQ